MTEIEIPLNSELDDKQSALQDIVPLPIESTDAHDLEDKNEETEDEGDIDLAPPPPVLTTDTPQAFDQVEAPPLPMTGDLDLQQAPQTHSEIQPLALKMEPTESPQIAPMHHSNPDELMDDKSNITSPSTTTNTHTNTNSNKKRKTNKHHNAYPAAAQPARHRAPRHAAPARSPPKFIASNLRAPPPLTPMSEIDSSGAVNHGELPPFTNMAGMAAPPLHAAADAHLQPPMPHLPPSGMDYDMMPPPPPPPPSNGLLLPPDVASMAGGLPPSIGALDDGQYPQIAAMPPPPPVPSYAIEYRCKLCGILYNTKSELIHHRNAVHPEQANPGSRFPAAAPPPVAPGHAAPAKADDGAPGMPQKIRFHCNVCARSFSGKQHFEYHMRTHSGEKPFKCETCGKAFRAKHSLKNHLRIHTGERPYQCKMCGKWFRQLGVMKNHIKNMHSQ
mmetsp:Transcript_68490/g.108765  ORF Transcript_68490/g.108765 Transcript_68490/m.108765 type:complete len:445 (-) Transcript_68490:149-1483(-)